MGRHGTKLGMFLADLGFGTLFYDILFVCLVNFSEIDFAFEGDTNYGTMAVSGTELRGVSICNRRNGLVGLENLQNTCYFNSILQCLAHICPLSKFMLSGLPFRANLNLKRK